MRRGIAFWRVMQYLKWAAVIIGIALAVLMAMVLPATAAVLGVISVAGVVLVRMVKNDD